MNHIQDFSDEALQSELKRREETKQKLEKPQQLKTIDPSQLREMCQQYIDELDENGYADEDFDHYIYEAAMTAVFGQGVWVWINKKLK